MLDQTDLEILQVLLRDCRKQWKTIGEEVHLTGQAVASRIRKMEEMGIIEGFTIKLNQQKMGLKITALITIFMKSANHQRFLGFLEHQTCIEEAHRVTGEGCYWIKANFKEQEELNLFLDQLLDHANYRVSLSLKKVIE
ncbi:Lrp/AsnC family transcriptional regulator [Brevibacillus ginsengisoli]|uniref:Lrp/AsnC family transcriptional regulator n=1 Tax=Brevibacillus ginsengisoli TaxID=363854 RepID=UPI003CEC592B